MPPPRDDYAYRGAPAGAGPAATAGYGAQGTYDSRGTAPRGRY